MQKKWVIIVSVCLFFTQLAAAQRTDTLIKKLDSLQRKSDSTGGQKNNINQNVYNERTKINAHVYFVLLGTDFIQEVTGPFHSSGKTWAKVGTFALVEGGMFLLDKPIQKYATQLMDRNSNFKGVSHFITNFGGPYEGYTLAAFGLYGIIFKNPKVRATTLLATQAYLVGGAMESLIKFASGRQRPNYKEPDKNDPEPIFHGPSFALHNSSSFPSGHTTVAFAAATVFAMEYNDRPLFPIIAYSAASLIGLSRITENAHWASDVFAGAALGYLTGKQVVNNYHRYAYLQNHKGLKNKVSLGMQFNYDHIEPALVLTFR